MANLKKNAYKSVPSPIEGVDTVSWLPLPELKASALIVPRTRTVFREDVDSVTMTTPDGREYVPWGANDHIPYDIIDLIESDETLATCQAFNAEVCYGSGLRYCTEEADDATRNEVEGFTASNSLAGYFLGVCQDMMHFSFAVSVIVLNADGSRIVELHRKQACYCRFTKADDKGRIRKVIYGPFRWQLPSDTFEEIELLNPEAPWRDLAMRMGRLTRPDGTRSVDPQRKFAIVSKFPGVDSLYYPIPHYASLFRGNWFNIKRLIAVAKEAKLKNAAPVRYIIEVSSRYWDNLFRDRKVIDPKERQKIVNAKKKEMRDFLTDTENAGSVLFSGKSISLDGKGETPDIVVTPIDSRNKEGGDWESDIAEAINMICFTMRVHSNLVGSVPGKTQTNNSGSDKRELYTIAQALKKPYHDILFGVHDLIIRFNGWEGVHPDVPFIQLTTLDEHRDAKQVTTNPQEDADDNNRKP